MPGQQHSSPPSTCSSIPVSRRLCRSHETIYSLRIDYLASTDKDTVVNFTKFLRPGTLEQWASVKSNLTFGIRSGGRLGGGEPTFAEAVVQLS